MARRRRRAPRRGRRRRSGRRWLRWAALAVVITVPLLYFAFSVIFYDPREPAMPAFPELVPRDVDVFVSRRGLARDFAAFPEPILLQSLSRVRAFDELQATPWYAGWSWPGRVQALGAQLAARDAELPFDLLDQVLGRELVVVGRLGEDGGEPSWALLARIGSEAKFAVESLDIAMLRERAVPGAGFAVREDPALPGESWRRLELPGEAPLFLARVNDLLVVSHDEELLRDVLGQVHGDPERSLGKSRLWLEGMPAPRQAPEDGFGAQLVVDLERLTAWLDGPDGGGADGAAAGAPPTRGGAPAAPEDAPGDDAAAARSPDALTNLVRALFDPHAWRDAVARFDVLDGDLALRSHAELQAWTGNEPHGLRDTPSFDASARLRDVTRLLPHDTTAVITANVDLRPFLRAVVASLDPDVVTLIETSVRNLSRDWPTWQIDSIDGLIGFLDRALGSEITIAVRPLDHQVPPGSQPLPLVTVMMPLRNPQLFEELTQAVIYGYRSLGIDPNKMYQQDEGVGTRKWLGLTGLPVAEVSFISMDWKAGQHLLVVSTSDDFLREIVSIYTGARTSLGDLAGVRRWIGRADRDGRVETPGALAGARGNVAAWVDVVAAKAIVQSYGDYVADTATMLDLGPLRATERRKLVQTSYPQYAPKGEGMPDDLAAQLEAQLDEIVMGIERRRKEQEVPARAAAFREGFAWMDLFVTGVGVLNERANEADVDLRLETLLSPTRAR